MTAYDFPPTAGKPTDGSFIYTAPTGVVYEWNGYSWTVGTIEPGKYVKKAGDIMTGALNVPAGASGTEAPQVQEVVQKSGDTITGNLKFANNAIVLFDTDSTTGVPDGTAPRDSAYFAYFGAYRCQNDSNSHIILSKSSAITTSSPNGQRIFISIHRDDEEIGTCKLEEYLAGDGWFDNQVTWKGNLNGALVKSKKIWNQRPSDFWSEGDYIGIGDSGGTTRAIYGSLHSAGSFGVSLCGNGYRNTSGGWTSYSSNTGQTGGAEISLQPGGSIIFYSDTSKSVLSKTPTERARFNNSGLTVSNLSGSGNRAVYSTSSGNLTNSSSDATLKTNVQTLDSQVNVVKALNPVSYNWIDTNLRGVQPEIGFIAQEVQELVPEVVGTNHDGTLSVDYPKMVATLTSALQEALTRIEALEAQNSN